MVAEVLKDMLPSEKPKQITAELIQEVVSDFFGIRIEDFKAKKEHGTLPFPPPNCHVPDQGID